MSQSSESIQARIVYLEERGLVAEAIVLLRNLLFREDSNAAFLRIKLILLLCKLGQFDAALVEVAELPLQEQRSVSMLLVAAKCHFQQGDREHAARSLLAAFQLAPDYQRGCSLLTLLLSLDWLEEAGNVLQMLLTMMPEHPMRWVEVLNSVDQVLNLGQLRAATLRPEWFEKMNVARFRQPQAAQLSQALFDIVYKLMLCEPSAGNVTSFRTVASIFDRQDECLALLEKLPNPSFIVLARVSDIYARSGEYGRAKEVYERAIGADSKCEPQICLHFSEEPPLVFLHRGEASYFVDALKQARRCNPKRRIVVIGDDHNRIDGIEYHRWVDYRGRSSRMVQAYNHCSINDFPYELLCLERWAVLLDFCEHWGLDEVIHIDSDVLLFDSMAESLAEMRRYSAAVCGYQAGIGYFRLSELLYLYELMCGFFEDPEAFAELKDSDSYSDMIFIGHAVPIRGWGSLFEFTGNAVFDNHIHVSDGFEFCDGRKHFEFIDGKPYARHIASDTLLRFRAIHFQGSAKSLMKEFLDRAQASL